MLLLFIFDLHFVVVSWFVDVLNFVVVSSHCFRRHPSPFCGLSLEFLHPILYFQPTPPQSDSRHFHFFSHSVLAGALQLWVGIFYPQALFTLRSFADILTCVYQGFPGGWQFILEVWRASYWSSKDRLGPSVCLIHSNPQTSYSEQFSFKILLNFLIGYGEILIYPLLTRFELFSLVQSIRKDH